MWVLQLLARKCAKYIPVAYGFIYLTRIILFLCYIKVEKCNHSASK